MAYLTYEEYAEMGGTLDQTAFTSLEFEAEALVDWYTFNRLQQELSQDEKVKRCMFMLIDLVYKMSNAGAVVNADGSTSAGTSAGIASQSNDGVSISYNSLSALDILNTSKAQVAQCIDRYLQGVTNSLGRRVLYRGLYPGE